MFRELKKGEKYAPKGARTNKDTPDNFQDAEYVFKNDGLVVVDLDGLGQELSRKIAKELFDNLIKTKYVLTDDGLHIYFKKEIQQRLPGATTISCLGLKTEYKKEKVVVKRNGVLREVLYDITEDYPTIPPEMLKLHNVNDNNLFGLSDGEGRNNKLFSHMAQCSKKNVNMDYIKSFINNFVFAEPTSQDKLDAMSFSSFDEQQEDNLTVDILNFLKQYQHEIVYYNLKVYVKAPIWTNNENTVNNYFITRFKNGLANTREIEELKKQIEYRTLSSVTGDFSSISFQNGYYDDGELILGLENSEFTPYYFSTKYTKDSENEHLNKIMSLITEDDKEMENYLYDIVALSLCTNREIRKRNPLISLLIGNGGNGKGIFLDLISNMFEDANISAVRPEEHKDMSMRHQLMTSMINLGDDIPDKPFSSDCISDLKSISMLEKVTTRDLHKSSLTVEPLTTLIYTSNHIPTFWERGEAVTRRFKFVEFNTNITKMVENGDISVAFFKELRTDDVKNAFFSKVIDRLEVLYKKGSISYPKKVTEYSTEFFKDNDYISLFMENTDISKLIETEDGSVKCINLYNTFNEFLLNEMGVKNEPITQITFNKQLAGRLKGVIKKVKSGGIAKWELV